MRPALPLKLSLCFGISAYCLVVLISKEASIRTVLLLGAFTLAILVGSLYLLWNVYIGRRGTDIETGTPQPEPPGQE